MYKEDFITRQEMESHFYEYHHFSDDTPPEVDFHQHNFYEIYIFISGNVSYTIEGRTYHLKPGDILITNTSDIHRPEILPSDKPYERIVIWLDRDFFDRIHDAGEDLAGCFLDAAKRNYRLIRPNRIQLSVIATFCRTVEEELAGDKIGRYTMTYAAIMSILVQISRTYYATPDAAVPDVMENSQINSIISYINDHLSERHTVQSIAERFYMSSSYLSHQFKKYTGLSVYSYITKKRLIMAYKLLSQNMSVTAAYNECGFSDYSNFLKAFKKEYGYNPSFFAVNGS